MSDGCSFVEDVGRECCVTHDRMYYFGGSRKDREYADKSFFLCMLLVGVPFWRARIRYFAVRLFGDPCWKLKGMSWSFGGGYFKYSDKPAEPIDG